MSRIYGIDLGTTNSLIGNGDILYTGLVSSSVNIKEGCQVKRSEYGNDIVSSYKVYMSSGDEGKLAVSASSIILKDLVNKANAKTQLNSKDVVISVPAKFSSSQRSAVAEAASRAGLNLRGLINEPTAAALYVCRELKDLVVVYDLGGGTFDVSILDSRIGLYTVVASDGRIIAGDNFDEAIMERALKDKGVKIRFRTKDNMAKLRMECRHAKEELQKQRCEQYVDMKQFGVDVPWELSVPVYIEIMKETFQETLRLTEYVLSTNVPQCETPSVVFVGGSTACPYLREWILKSLRLKEVPCEINPDLLVAKGVALYARMLEEGKVEELVEDVTRRLCIADKSGRAKTIIDKNSIIPIESSITVCNYATARFLELDLYQGDSIVAAENEYIGTLQYDYGEVKEAMTGDVEVVVKVDRDGIVRLSGVDVLTGISQDIVLNVR